METAMEEALLFALIKVLDNYYTPLGHRIRCWKSKMEGNLSIFIVGMNIPQFEGPDKILDWFIDIEYWDKFNIIEIPEPENVMDESEVIKELLKI